jgi:hypothetical protein
VPDVVQLAYCTSMLWFFDVKGKEHFFFTLQRLAMMCSSVRGWVRKCHSLFSKLWFFYLMARKNKNKGFVPKGHANQSKKECRHVFDLKGDQEHGSSFLNNSKAFW